MLRLNFRLCALMKRLLVFVFFTLNVRGGVPKLSKWMQHRFPDAFRPVESHYMGKCDCVYVDINEHIYLQARKAKSSNQLINLVLKSIKATLRRTPPKSFIVLAVDGPGPIAKVILQRQRRRKDAAKTARIELSPTPGETFVEQDYEAIVKLALTPGTSFMMQLSDAIEKFAEKTVSSLAANGQLVSCVVSGSQVAGEGEIKCLGHMLDVAATSQSRGHKGQRKAPTHVIHGGDSDLLLISLASNVANVFVVDTSNHDTIFDAEKCHEALSKAFPPDRPTARRALDLVCIVLLISGNDYMAGMNTPFSLGRTFDVYEDLAKLTEASLGNSFNIVDVDVDGVGADSCEVPSQRFNGRRGDKQAASAHIDRLSLAKLLKAMYESRLNSMLFNAKELPLDEAASSATTTELDRAEAFIRGMEWVLTQYVTGKCPDYGMPPVASTSLPALYAVLTAIKPNGAHAGTAVDIDAGAGTVWGTPRRAVLAAPPVPAIYNLLVQPIEGKKLVPKVISELMDPSSPIGWLYSQGCSCSECYRLNKAMAPLNTEVSGIGSSRLSDPVLMEQFTRAQAQLKALQREEREHAKASHGGKRLYNNELPSLPYVVALVEDLLAKDRSEGKKEDHTRSHDDQGNDRTVVDEEEGRGGDCTTGHRLSNDERRLFELERPKRFDPRVEPQAVQ